MSRHVCAVLSIDVVKNSRFECCFWSAQCIETKPRTSDNVKTLDFISLIVYWWNFLDKVVYCNIWRSSKAAFLELEKATFTVATLVPMLTIITPGPDSYSKRSKTFHAKSNLKVDCEKKCLWYWKVIVWVLQISIMQSDIYAMYSTFVLNCSRILMTIVALTWLINYSWEMFLVSSDWKTLKT